MSSFLFEALIYESLSFRVEAASVVRKMNIEESSHTPPKRWSDWESSRDYKPEWAEPLDQEES